jgi:hypothetical protein
LTVPYCKTCGQLLPLPGKPLERMPPPGGSAESIYRSHLGNVLIVHGWVTYDGILWTHPQEPGEVLTDITAIARELGKLKAGLRRRG